MENNQQQYTLAVVHNISDVKIMAEAIAKSGLFGIKTADQAVALMLIAQAEGLHPAVAARDYDIIQGRPALKARAMQSRFQVSGGKVEWVERSDEAAEALFSHPQSPKPVSIRWDMARAQKAGLGGKDNWRKFPRQMLSARVISEGVAACYPAATSGLYVPEEVEDFDNIKSAKAPAPEKPKAVKPIEPAKVEDPEIVQPIHTEPVKPEPVKQEAPKPEPKPEPVKLLPTERVAAAKNNTAEEISLIRSLVIELGIKTREDYLTIISTHAGRAETVKDPIELSPAERKSAIDKLKIQVAEKKEGEAANG
jgi:hypothetical protein